MFAEEYIQRVTETLFTEGMMCMSAAGSGRMLFNLNELEVGVKYEMMTKSGQHTILRLPSGLVEFNGGLFRPLDELDDQDAAGKAKQCWVCGKEFGTLKNRKRVCILCHYPHCDKCCPSKMTIPSLGVTDKELVCLGCVDRAEKTEAMQQAGSLQEEKDADRMMSAEQEVQLLINGATFLKHGRKGFPHNRFVLYLREARSLAWVPKEEDRAKAMNYDGVIISGETELKQGLSTPNLQRTGKQEAADRCFSVVVKEADGSTRTLDLEAPDVGTKDKWVKAIGELIWLINHSERQRALDALHKEIEKLTVKTRIARRRSSKR